MIIPTKKNTFIRITFLETTIRRHYCSGPCHISPATQPLSHSDTLTHLLYNASAVMNWKVGVKFVDSYMKMLLLNRLSYDFAIFLHNATGVIFVVDYSKVKIPL